MSPAHPRHTKTVRVSQRFFISPAASVRIENLTTVGKAERAEKRPHVAVIEIGIDPETVQPRITGECFDFPHKPGGESATPHLLRHRKTVHHHIRRLTQPFPFNRAVSRFAAEQHGAIGDRNVSRSQYIPATVRNIPPDIVQSGIPVLPLAAAQQAHLLLGLQDNPPNRVDIRYRRFAEKTCALRSISSDDYPACFHPPHKIPSIT